MTTKKDQLSAIPKREASAAALELIDARIEGLDQKLSGQMENVTKSIEALALQIGQLSSIVKQTSQNIDKLAQTVDGRLNRLETAIEADREIAKLQSTNVQQMVMLAAKQQETINTLVQKLAA